MTDPVSTTLCAAWADLADLPDTRPALDDAQWMDLLVAASEILWALSGRQWSGAGDCTATATLYQDGDQCLGWWPGSNQVVAGFGAAHYLPRPAADGQRALKLPHDEATTIQSVTVGGEAFVGYRQQGSWLHRIDGKPWVGAEVVVTYRWGVAPPTAGKVHAVNYALELGKAIAGDTSCRLPKRVVSLTRQGVSMALIDPQRYLEQGKLGIVEIDQWLAAVNPHAVPERASIWSPDVPRAVPS
jgi:hypothetical protein